VSGSTHSALILELGLDIAGSTWVSFVDALSELSSLFSLFFAANLLPDRNGRSALSIERLVRGSANEPCKFSFKATVL
jgi:hypothetical protein